MKIAPSQLGLTFLSSYFQDIYATPAAVVGEESGVPMQAQVAALRLQAKLGPTFSITEPASDNDDEEPAAVTWLPYMLAAASSSFNEVREAAAECLEALSAAMSGSSLVPRAIQAAVSGLGASSALIRADPNAASLMLRARLLPQGNDGEAEVAPATGAKKRSKTASSSASKGSSQGAVVVAAPNSSSQSSLPALTPALARELYALMASTMADLSGNSLADLSAARTTLACLLPPSDAPLTRGILEQKALLPQPCLTLLASLQDADVVINMINNQVRP